ncbi:hypothetical protein [Mobilicoccus pelagius]|uniref:Coenzyme Q-binding protein COQ10 START domain-containing protein n=1 Tax=Mobilicoccus pelagius NBRC 104925 TaxID=1089455 RepID=H5USL4_9MICO|nr:hypothetical protein [Mobilicoccus pelagius]GAB48722.1 hypothetical protein MOPEL_080_00010 [Mobilicoccus pelagius NBRC 104925]
MARFTVRLTVPIASPEAWRRVWDLDAHTRFIPLTTLRGDGTGDRDLRAGSRFVARTALGPLHVDDVMEVRRFDAPASPASTGRAALVKTGRVVGGDIDVTVAPAPSSAGRASRTHVEWRQDITLRGVPAVADPVVAAVARLAYGTVLRRLLRTAP